MCSTVASSEVACSRSSSETRFGSAAHTAGRKKPVAIPLTAASATISAGSSTNGSATNVPARTRSETIIRRRRERRSTSGPSVTPISTIGRKSAIRSAASQRPDPVRSKMSTESASAARYVPTEDPAVAQKRSAKLRFRLSGDSRPVTPSGTARRYHPRPDGNSDQKRRGGTRGSPTSPLLQRSDPTLRGWPPGRPSRPPAMNVRIRREPEGTDRLSRNELPRRQVVAGGRPDSLAPRALESSVGERVEREPVAGRREIADARGQ